VLDETAVPEFLQFKCTPERLAAALTPLLADTPERRRQVESLGRLDAVMGLGGEAPSARAAAVVMKFLGGARPRP
jgi:lipid-A-disaccharide synthase